MASARLDHILQGVPDVDAAVDDFERVTGVRPIAGGEHPAFGTVNALVSLSDGTFFELIGPGPGVEGNNLGGQIAELGEPRLIAFALASSELDVVADRVRAGGFEAQGPVPGRRTTPEGGELEWRMLLIGGHDFGDFVPFLIDWGDSPHPATTSPTGLSVERFEVRHPEAGVLRQIYRDLLGADVETVQADHAMLDLVMDTPKGRVAFRGDGPMRFLEEL
jgi:hypothetical protein